MYLPLIQAVETSIKCRQSQPTASVSNMERVNSKSSQPIEFPSIPDGVGGKWDIEKWECHRCRARNSILDRGMAWEHKIHESCRNCPHVRCANCFDVDEGDYPLQHCDGAIIPNMFNESDSWRYLEYRPRPGDPARVLFNCPYYRDTGCRKVFLKSTHAARHAQVHQQNPAYKCTIQTCNRMFKRKDDCEKHTISHRKTTDGLLIKSSPQVLRRARDGDAV